MGNCPDCREIGPRTFPTEGKLCDDECVSASRVAHLHIRTFSLKFHLCGSNPQHELQYPRPLRNLQHGQRKNGPPSPSFTPAKRNGFPRWPPKNGPPFLQTQNGTGRRTDRDKDKGGYSPLSVRRVSGIFFFKLSEPRCAPVGRRDTDKGDIFFVCKASGRKLFNYRKRGPVRRAGRDTEKWVYFPFSVRRISGIPFFNLGTAEESSGFPGE